MAVRTFQLPARCPVDRDQREICGRCLRERLRSMPGVRDARLKAHDGEELAVLELDYDPRLMPLAQLEAEVKCADVLLCAAARAGTAGHRRDALTPKRAGDRGGAGEAAWGGGERELFFEDAAGGVRSPHLRSAGDRAEAGRSGISVAGCQGSAGCSHGAGGAEPVLAEGDGAPAAFDGHRRGGAAGGRVDRALDSLAGSAISGGDPVLRAGGVVHGDQYVSDPPAVSVRHRRADVRGGFRGGGAGAL